MYILTWKPPEMRFHNGKPCVIIGMGKSGAALPNVGGCSAGNTAPLRYLDVGTIRMPDGLFLVLSEPQ